MIGDGWTDEPSVRPTPMDPPLKGRARVALVTGTRAEFGLLRPVGLAIAARQDLELAVIAAGAHLISPALTFREVKASFNIAEVVPMQIAGKTGRAEDAEALGRGVGRFTRAYEKLRPDWVLVLGDRIEAFAAAAAASVAGYAVAHIHGGDRAEGVADEGMRHAITKLAHVHFAASEQSAERIVRMGEARERVHVVGSPAIDGLAAVEELSQSGVDELYGGAGFQHAKKAEEGSRGLKARLPVLLLLHPVGRPSEVEEAAAAEVLEGLRGERVLALHPNHDPGREGVLRAIESAGVPIVQHLPRERFVGLLKHLAKHKGVLVGNSSAGLIEAAALRVPVVDIGPRQGGRERCGNVVHVEHERAAEVRAAVGKARELDLGGLVHPYGDGHAGERIAKVLAEVSPHQPWVLRKRNAY
ncbi:MAG TPA: UDP-N-acetylglucosamine 2-epimerase [Phycisphaerales bacterium]|nr:UDP-N-acetylglucosamine 2-epimerase [Phycisphaerales bacterium]